MGVPALIALDLGSLARIASLAIVAVPVSCSAPRPPETLEAPTVSPDVGVPLAWDRRQLPGRYGMVFRTETADGTVVVANVEFEVVQRDDGRFDLYITKVGGNVPETRLRSPPVQDFAMDGRGPGDARRNPDGPLEKTGGDIATSFFFCLPTAPGTPVSDGSTWTGERVIPLAKTVSEHPVIDVAHEFRGEHLCKDGPCVRIAFKGASGPRVASQVGTTLSGYEYDFRAEALMTWSGMFVSSTVDLETTMNFNSGPIDVKGEIRCDRLPDAPD